MENSVVLDRTGPVPSKTSLAQILQRHAPEAMEALLNILRTTRNESLRFGAAKLIIDKTIPDLKSEEIKGEAALKIMVAVMNYGSGDHLPNPVSLQPDGSQPPSVEGVTRPEEIPGIELAPEGKEDNSGDKPVDKVG